MLIHGFRAESFYTHCVNDLFLLEWKHILMTIAELPSKQEPDAKYGMEEGAPSFEDVRGESCAFLSSLVWSSRVGED